MWKPHGQAANRSGLRYPSDLTDAEWVIVAPMIPPARHGGSKRSVNVREVLNGIFYILWTGCQWKALPKDLPPKSAVNESSSSIRSMRQLVRSRRHIVLYLTKIARLTSELSAAAERESELATEETNAADAVTTFAEARDKLSTLVADRYAVLAEAAEQVAEKSSALLKARPKHDPAPILTRRP